MRFCKVTAVYFSPTGNTRRAAQVLASSLASSLGLPCGEIDITLPAGRGQTYAFAKDELVVFASPTYAGRIPNKMQPTFAANFCGDGTAAVPLVLFGNRSFQDALSELGSLLRQNGFVPVGGASLVSAHVFSGKLASGRPDASDLTALRQFAAALAEELRSADVLPQAALPGNDPVGPYYTPLGTDGKPAKFLRAVPKVSDACGGCGQCAAVCPMGSIAPDNSREMRGVCIKCQACILTCPQKARYFDDPAFLSHVTMLEQNYTARKENGFYR